MMRRAYMVETSDAGQVTDPPIPFELVHAMRGRVRMRAVPPHTVEELAEAIREFLDGRPGIEDIRMVPDCQSVVLTYDAEVLRAEDLRALTQVSQDDSWVSWVRSRLLSPATLLGALAGSIIGPLTGSLIGGAQSLRGVGSMWQALQRRLGRFLG